MTILGALLDPRRLPTWVAAAVALASGLLLLAPDAFLRPLHLEGLREEHGRALGLAFLVAAAFSTVSALAFFLRRREVARGMRERASRLDPAERAVLREFVFQSRNTIAAPVSDPTVAGLLTAGALSQIGGHMQPTPQGLVAAMRVDPAFRKHLRPAAIGLETWSPSDAERRRLLSRRPAFVGNVARWDAVLQL